MKVSINEITLLGHLGNDADIKEIGENREVANFSLATTHSYKQNNEWVSETTWHNCVLFNPSEADKSILLKGEKVLIRGRLNKRDYTNSNGQKVYVTEVIVNLLASY